MSTIMTVTGPLDSDKLGFTSMHEHTLYNIRFMRDRFEALIPDDAPVRAEDPVCLEKLGDLKHAVILSLDNLRMTDEAVLTSILAEYKNLGGSAVVDVSTTGFRADPVALRRLSETSGVRIVASTGLYALDSWPAWLREADIDELARFMRNEIANGLDGTDVYPGHIKAAIEEPFCDPEVRALKAAARVAAETTLSLTVHQGMMLAAEDGIKIADIIESQGQDLQRTVIAHNDTKIASRDIPQLITNPKERQLNFDTARRLLDRGANLSIDCFGHYWDSEPLGKTHVLDWQRAAMLAELIGQGYAGQLVIGTDTFLKMLLKPYGGEAYIRLLTFAVPTLKSIGIADEDIAKITTTNPARILAC